jgi:YD repeat-containing protein
VTTWNRNAVGVLQTITHNDKDGAATETFGYDANGDITSDIVTRGSMVGISKSATYDQLGRVHQQTGNNGQSVIYAYDGDGNVQSLTNAMGHTTSYAYDALNRVTTVTESGGASATPPSTAPSLTVPAKSTNGAYAVSWTAVTGASSYTLQEQASGGGWVAVQSSSATSWNASNKSNGSYGYRVSACNVAGCGAWSSTATITVAVAPGSAPTLTVPASNTSGAFAVSWSSVNYATSYTLQEQVNGGAWASAYTGVAKSWSTSGRAAGTYGYRVQACNSNGCSGWSSTKTTTVSTPIAANGQSYSSTLIIPSGQSSAGNIGFDIVNGTTWEVFVTLNGPNHLHAKQATGSVPAAAVKVQYTWTYTGVPSGYVDGMGSISNGASTPTAISSNPISKYTTANYSGISVLVGRTYQVRIDFFNATGANISSSICTLTAELEGTP